jgi:Salmonella virulence plasmid 65kDa B protein/FG-GAP-like repeat
MANRMACGLRVGAFLVGMFSFAGAIAQTVTVTAVNDAAEVIPGTVGATTPLGANDVVPANSLFTLRAGSTCVAPVSVSATGIATYSAPASGACVVNYKVCAPSPNTTICGTAVLTVTAVAEEELPLGALVKAITPTCTSLTATPATVFANSKVTLAATCTKSPTSYQWFLGTTLLATTATPTYAPNAPATAQTYSYSVVAKRGSIASARISANVMVAAAPALSVSAAANTTANSSVTIQGSVTAPANTVDVLVSAGSSSFVFPGASGSFTASWTPTQSGVYQIRTQAISKSTGQVLTTNLTKVVVTDVPAATALALPGTSSAGATAGSFAVSDMGGAQYSIPIAVPPGIAGMQPSVSLNYSSQGGNGHVGVGWSIGGLSAVTRCPKTIAQDGFKAGINYDADKENDAFCLDGQRLIQISTRAASDPEFGAILIREYRTEIDRFDRIESFETTGTSLMKVAEGPSNFRVTTKSGQIMDYGWRWWDLNRGFQQANSRINTVRTWALDRVSDRNGNYYAIDYEGTNSLTSAPIRGPLTAASPPVGSIAPVGAYPQVEFYPRQITYTINSSPSLTGVNAKVNRVVFEYEDRPANDRHVFFDQGAGQHILAKRLKSISTYVDGSIIDYPLVPYVSGKELYPICAGANCGTKVKQFTLTYDPASPTNRSRLLSVQECEKDNVCLPATTFQWSGFAKNMTGSGSRVISTGGTDISNFEEFRAADINGDGRTDLWRRYGDPGHIQALVSQADGSFVERRIYATTGEVAGSTNTTVYALDMNGDGRADFFSINNATSYMRICITNESATAFSCSSPQDQGVGAPDYSIFYQGDFDGDGKVDLLFYRKRAMVAGDEMHKWDLIRGTESGFSNIPQALYTPYRSQYGAGGAGAFDPAIAFVGDFNGDGRADLYMLKIPDTCNQ